MLNIREAAEATRDEEKSCFKISSGRRLSRG